MKILAIRGRNLASLAGNFEVDFTAEPLTSAGVFAITGPTGAGKSTLLDALSLALFHDTPRLKSAGESGVQLPDGKDGTISPKDARNILRRGSGEGFAEVDYIGLDSQRWRARWETRRARERADGRLQAPSASLQNLETQQQHGGKLVETREAITKTTGLSYEQFCRSILLAQNEFAAFLRSTGKDRAELLEALTGTEIYRLISKKCHERTNEEKLKVQALETQLGRNPPLSEAQRTELEQQLEAARALQDEREAAQKALQKEASWHTQGRGLQKQHTQLQAELENWEAEHKARADESAQIQRMEAIESARPLYRDLQQATTALSQHERQRSAIEAAVTSAQSAHRDAEAGSAAARNKHKAAEGEWHTQAPATRKARELDHQIGALNHRLGERTEQISEAAKSLEHAEEQHEKGTQASAENKARINAWSTWQNEHPEIPAAADTWQQAGMVLSEALRTTEQAKEADQNLKALAGQAKQEQARISKLQTKLESARQDLKTARLERKKVEQQESAIDSSAIEEEQERLANRLRSIERLETRITEQGSASEAVASARQAVETLQQEQSERSQRLQALEREIPAAGERAGQAHKAWEASSAIADQHSAALRRQLVEGEPCPVCGSCAHPGHAQGEDEITRLVEELAKQLETAGNEFKALEIEQTTLKAAFDQAEKQLKDSQAERLHRQNILNEATLARQQAVTDLKLPPDSDLGQLPKILTAQREVLDREQTALDQKRHALDQARKRLTEARSAGTKAEDNVEAAEQNLKDTSTAAAPILDAYQRATHQLESRTQEAQEAHKAVLSTLNLESEPNSSEIATLHHHWCSGEKIRQDAERAQERQPVLLEQLEEHKERIAKLAHERQQLEEKREELAKEIETLQRHRIEQLGERDPDAVETELSEALGKAREAVEAADKILQTAAAKWIETQSSQRSWTEVLANKRTALDQSRAELSAWLEKHNGQDEIALERNDLEGLLSLLAVPDEDWRPKQAALQKLEQTIRDHRTRLDMVNNQIKDWQSQALSDRSETSVAQLLDESTESLSQAMEANAQLKSALRDDDQRKQAAAEQLEKIRAQQAIFDQWRKLNELIGSSDGSKFRDYAQQFTLDVLMAHANAQLRTLAPRYRLQRGKGNLNILVVDDDMGGEVRGVHSLSGGETFLAALALALGLAELSSQRIRLESLFIDEGFGSLDADTLRVAMDALDRLQAQGRKVGVISHVQEMSDRIGTQIRVERAGAGRSEIHIQD